MRRHMSRWLVAVMATALIAAGCTDDGDDDASPDDTNAAAGDYEATIRRSSDGVPHITAADEASLAFGQGYASAEDRSCDLADQLVKIKGTRAKWLGPGDDDENIDSDAGWLALGIYDRALEEWPDKSADVQTLFTGFSAGWNAALADIGVDQIAGWCAGEEWVQPLTPQDVYAYARSITLQASGSRVADFIATATPPVAGESPSTSEASLGALAEAPVASNAWAVGTERSADGGGLLLANPHFPWEGELRFWEVHLTIPDELDIYGVQLSGLPGIGIGFTETFGWSHTVSAGNRFTAYTLDLVPGKPTTYLYDGEEREMTSRDIEIEVTQPDGSTTTETRTMWSSHYGPILDFPGVGWTDGSTITYRDANIDNDEFADQYLAMNRAKNLDEFIAAQREITGVPLFNTVAVSADGRAWYADTSATPALSDEAIEAYEASKVSDPIVGIAAQSRAVLLDGSDSLYEWVDLPGARDPGLVPFAEMPMTERGDFVFNANDSFWVNNGTETLDGDYSPLHGAQDTARSPRTRENAVVLRDTSATGPAGDDGAFDLDEFADAALQNFGYTSRALKDEVVARCEGASTVPLEPLVNSDDEELLPATTVDVTEACDVLAQWGGSYNLDSVGAPLWREFISRYEGAQLTNDSPGLWATPFDPAQPIDTPSGLAGGEASDVVLVNLARAVQIIEAAGFTVDQPLGELQYADRDGTRVPIHGGDAYDGVTNIVGYGGGSSTMEETPERGDTFAPRSNLSSEGYLINNGTSFIMALHFGPDGPEAKVLLTYGDTQDRSSPLFVEATERFSAKDWRTVTFKNEDLAADRNLSEKTVSG